MRTRGYIEPGQIGRVYQIKTFPDTIVSKTMLMSNVEKRIDDVVTPGGFKALSNAGAQPINHPCFIKTDRIKRGGGGTELDVQKTDPTRQVLHTGGGSLTDFWRQINNVPLLGYPVINTGVLEGIVKAKALASIDKAPYAVTEDIATIRETIKFLRNPFGVLDLLSKNFKRDLQRKMRRRGKTLTRAQAIASLWAEYRFAFGPAARSVVNVIDSLNVPDAKRENRMLTAHAFDSRREKRGDTITVSGTSFRRTSSREVKARAVVQYRMESPLKGWRYKYGFRLKDIPELVWDLVPYSFMIDRLLDVGTTIRGLTNLNDPGVAILGATYSLTDKLSQTISYYQRNNSSWNITISPDTDVFETDSYSREVWYPTINDTASPLNLGGLVKDLTSIADLTALIIQRLK